MNDAALQAAVTYSDSLTEWALLVLGGTLALILGTSHERPKGNGARIAYLLFVPGWVLLVISAYYGVTVRRAYIGHLSSKKAELLDTIRLAATDQQTYLQLGFAIFACWVIGYVLWWILSDR